MKNLSIVFVSKDNVDDVRKTLSSIEDILKFDVQLIVVDSSNTSLIKDMITSLESDSDIVYKWQKPQGIYPAMNEAIRLSKNGNLVWFLNPGDVLLNNQVLTKLRREIDRTGSDWGFAQAIADFPPFAESFPNSLEPITGEGLLVGQLRISHQAMCVSKESLQAIGNFDTSFRIAADFQMQYRLLSYSSPIFVDELMVQFDTTGISHDKTFLTFFESTRVRISSKELQSWKLVSISCKILCRRIIGFIRNRLSVK